MSVAILKKCSLFFELYDAEIEKVVKNCSVKTVDQDIDIVKQGEIGHEFYIILDGEAVITKEKFYGTGVNRRREVTELGILREGDVFGELILLNDNLRTATVTAKTQTDLLVVNQESIYSLYNFQSKIFSILLLNLSRILSRKLKFTTDQLEKIYDAERTKKIAS